MLLTQLLLFVDTFIRMGGVRARGLSGVKRTGTVLSFQLSLQLQGPSPPIHATARAVPADSRTLQ